MIDVFKSLLQIAQFLLLALSCIPQCAAMCAGAVVNARDHRKRTPLHVAAEEGHKELIEFLLSKKADATITDLDGNTPVDLAAKRQHEDDAVEILVEHSKSSKRDKTSLQMAWLQRDLRQ